jgi:hypothetical protein
MESGENCPSLKLFSPVDEELFWKRCRVVATIIFPSLPPPEDLFLMERRLGFDSWSKDRDDLPIASVTSPMLVLVMIDD